MSDEMSYGCAARLRLALSHAAAGASDDARRLVETHDDGVRPNPVEPVEPVERASAAGGAAGGSERDLVAEAARLMGRAREILALAVSYERRRGASWEEIGAAVGISRHAAQERYSRVERELDRALLTSWLDPERAVDLLPPGAFDPGRTAARLDRWALARRQPADAANRVADERIRRQPVSSGLGAMTTAEHSAMVTAAAPLLGERLHDAGLSSPEYRRIETGLLRRKVELYERMLVDDSCDCDPDEVHRLLRAARKRLAALAPDSGF